MSSDLEHWNINATVFKDRVEEIHFFNDPAKNIRRQQQKHTWHVGQFLGRGGFGEVRLQQNHETGQARAVKRITMIGNVLSKSECEKELDALLEFSKPKFKEAACFVEFYGWFTDGPEVFLAMEFVRLGDLEKNVRAHSGKIPESEARDIASQIISGLEIMHALKFAHRDLKPQNVMVVNGPPHWWVKLADFGLSKRLTETSGYHTRSGSDSYMAPEILRYLKSNVSNSDYTDAVDMWATGCIVYRLVTGVVPFPPGTLLMKYCEDKSLFPYDQLIDNGVKSGAVRFLQGLLATSPGERPSAVQALKHPWIKTASNFEKQPLPMSKASEAANASLSELTISDIGYNTVSHDGLKSEAETHSGPKSHHEQFAPESPSYNDQLTDFPSQATVLQRPLSGKIKRKTVTIQPSSEQNYASIDKRETEERRIPAKSKRTLVQEMNNAKSAEITAENQEMKTEPKEETFETLFEKLKIFESNKSLNKRLLEAGKTGDGTLVRLLLDKGANIEAANNERWTPIHHASFEGHEAIVQLLLDKGANLEAVDNSRWTPIHHASFQGHEAIVQLLLDNGVNIEAVDKLGVTPLHRASFVGHLAVVELLLDKGVNIEAVDKGGWMPIHYASFKGHLTVVQLLLDKGANIEAADKGGRTALKLATDLGRKEVTKLLLERGADASRLQK